MDVYNTLCNSITLMSKEEQQLIKQIGYETCYDTKDYHSLYKFLEDVIPDKKLRTVRDIILYETQRTIYQVADDAFMYAFSSDKEIIKMVQTFIKFMNSKHFDYKTCHNRVLYNYILLMLCCDFMPSSLRSKLVQLLDPDYLEYLADPLVLDAYIGLKKDTTTKELMIQCIFEKSK